MQSVVLIGTEGSGKTVLLSVLAKLYGPGNTLPIKCADGAGRLVLRPADQQTAEYVSRAHSDVAIGIWPLPTTPGEPVDLQWKITLPSGQEGGLHMPDSSGKDWREVFAAGSERTANGVSPRLSDLIEKVKKAKLAVFAIDLAAVGPAPAFKLRQHH